MFATARLAQRGSRTVLRLLAGQFLLLFLLLQGTSATPQPSASSILDSGTGSLNLQSLQAELRRIISALMAHPSPDQIAALETKLPPYWAVQTAERKYEVPTEPLRSLLEDAPKNPSQQAQRIAQAQEWVEELAAEVDGYASGETQPPDVRAKLTQILAAREFRTSYQQSAWEQFKQRVWTWLLRQLAALVRRMGSHPIASRALFWLILLGGVAGMALLLFRAWTRRAHFNELIAAGRPAVSQSWQQWIRAARVAADGGAFRDAIHSLYWAAIVQLEDSRVIARERSRTPRERLRQLPSPAQLSIDPANATEARIAQASRLQNALQVLTARLESTWYAGQPATRQDYVESLQLVEELGCRWQ
jgi:Domain of unknown function (DUF4129)